MTIFTKEQSQEVRTKLSNYKVGIMQVKYGNKEVLTDVTYSLLEVVETLLNDIDVLLWRQENEND